MNLAPVEELLRTAADALFDEFAGRGYAIPGNNGPYHCQETPVRNTGHWLVLYAYLWKTTREEKYKDLCLTFGDYLVHEERKSRSGAVQCVEDPRALDPINGLIGQAWTIEALLYAYGLFHREEYLTSAVRIFKSQTYDGETGFWKRTDMNGTVIDYDYTINHQVWFCLAGLLILKYREDGDIARQTERFLDQIHRE